MPGRNSVPTRAQTRATLTSIVPTAHPMCHVSGLPLYLELGCVVCVWGGAVTAEGCLPLLLQPVQERQFLLSPFPTRQTGQASSSFRNPQNAPLHNFHSQQARHIQAGKVLQDHSVCHSILTCMASVAAGSACTLQARQSNCPALSLSSRSPRSSLSLSEPTAMAADRVVGTLLGGRVARSAGREKIARKRVFSRR